MNIEVRKFRVLEDLVFVTIISWVKSCLITRKNGNMHALRKVTTQNLYFSVKNRPGYYIIECTQERMYKSNSCLQPFFFTNIHGSNSFHVELFWDACINRKIEMLGGFPLGHERSGPRECADLKVNTFRLCRCVFLADLCNDHMFGVHSETAPVSYLPKRLLQPAYLSAGELLSPLPCCWCSRTSRMIKKNWCGCSASKEKSLSFEMNFALTARIL